MVGINNIYTFDKFCQTMNAESFGKLIKTARNKKNMDLKEVQSETGIDFSLLSRLETGERLPSKEQVYHLADFYDIDRNELLIAWQGDKVYTCIKDYDLNIIEQVLDIVKNRFKQHN